MTIRQQYPLPGYGTPPTDHGDEDDDNLSPSDGYFGQSPTVPNTVFVPNPQTQSQSNAAMDKAKEAAAEMRSTIYTPATTATPAGSSRRDSTSTYNGYREGPNGPDLLDDDPPPMYSDTPSTSQWSQSQDQRSQTGVSQHRDAPNRVRQAHNHSIPPSQAQASSPRHGTAAERMADRPLGDLDVIPEDDSALLPITVLREMRQRKRRGCGRGRWHKRDGHSSRRKWKKALFSAISAVAIVWLILHLVFKGHNGHARTTIPNPNAPPNPSLNTTKPIPVPSRSYTQHETSSSISGTYPLYDLLSLSTTSGSISVTIDPQPGTAPAILKLTSASGSIKIHFATNANVPDRLYQTSISTQSGSVRGNLLVSGAGVGGETRVGTRSGSIVLSFTPILSYLHTGTSILSTTSASGSQKVTIESPKSHETLSNMSATHTSIGSGSLKIQYPGEWKGIVHAKSGGSGSVNVNGDGLHYQLKGSREVYAWRGQPGEEVETVEVNGHGSGSITFGC